MKWSASKDSAILPTVDDFDGLLLLLLGDLRICALGIGDTGYGIGVIGFVYAGDRGTAAAAPTLPLFPLPFLFRFHFLPVSVYFHFAFARIAEISKVAIEI